MEETSELFLKLFKRKKPNVPDGFFQNFHAQLNSKILSDLKEKNDVPQDFFKNFHSQLKDEIDAENALSDLGIKKSKKPNLPTEFRTEFVSELQKNIARKKSRTKLIRISFWSATSSVAAALAILFLLNTKDQTPNDIAVEQPQTMSEENLDTYAEFVDEGELIDYIVENNVDLGEDDEDDVMLEYLDSDLEDIYLDID